MPPLALKVTAIHQMDLAGAKGQVSAAADHGELTIRGWAIGDTAPIAEMEIFDQAGRLVVRVPVDLPRPDLVIAFGAERADQAGFEVTLGAHGTGEGRLLVSALSSDRTAEDLASIEVEVARARFYGRLGGQTSGVSWSALDSAPPYWSVLDVGESRKVLVGREGWLFLRNDANDVLAQHTGKVRFGRAKRRAWKRVLSERQRFAEERGFVWLCVVIPDKESLYPEYLPEQVKLSAERPVHEFLRVAERLKAPVVYALPHLEAKKTEGELYARTDTHWNHRGAYVAYRMMCRRLVEREVGIDAVNEASIAWSEKTVSGDLGSKVLPRPIEGSMCRADLRRHRANLVFDNGIRNHGRVSIYERPNEGPSCVVFGESFVGDLVLFLKETFGRLVWVHTSMFVSEILKQEKPDVVLSLPLERFLIRVPDDRDALRRLSETAQRKGGELPWTL